MKNLAPHIDEGDVFASFMHPDEWYRHEEKSAEHVDEGDVFASFIHPDEWYRQREKHHHTH